MLTLTVHELIYALRDVPSGFEVVAWVGDESTPDLRAVSNPQVGDGRVILRCGTDGAIEQDDIELRLRRKIDELEREVERLQAAQSDHDDVAFEISRFRSLAAAHVAQLQQALGRT